ncbi:MAG: hypothetical protein NZ108_07195, partial [Bacteroidia bacterium]|nr:hypothetical protein [Bacteroidia bacterium]
DQSKLVIGGTGGFLPPLPYIYDVDINSGNITASVQVTSGQLTPTQEVRSIAAAKNGKYYWLSHDSVGFITQNFGVCPSGTSALLKRTNGYNLGYKCENWRYDNSGIMAIRASDRFFYTHRGNQIDKRSLADGSILQTATIPGGGYTPPGPFTGSQVLNSGIDIDSCGNVYVGSRNQVIKYDENLNVISTINVTYNVYDIHVLAGGEVLVCGSTGNSNNATRSGAVQVVSFGACSPRQLICCDATICNLNAPICLEANPVQLTPTTPGGTWSGPGVNSSGLFNPTLAGVGTHTIYYTLPCGMDSTRIIVSPCASLSVCQQNGNLIVSGGVGPYTWQNQTITQNCSACLVGCIFPPGCAVNVTTWTNFATGTTIPAPSNYPIRVVDASSTTFVINSLASVPPCNNCPPPTAGSNSPLCAGQTLNLTASTVSGATYLWNGPNGFTSTLQNPSISNVTTAASGTYNVVAIVSGCTSSVASVTVTIHPIPTSPIAAYNSPLCSGQTLNLTASTVAGATYAWVGPNGFSSTIQNPSITNVTSASSGNYNVVAIANGCTSAVSTVSVVINSPPSTPTVSSNSPNCAGSPLNLVASSSPGASYSWTGPNGFTSNQQNPSIPNPTTAASGIYSVVAIANGCTSATSTINVIVNQVNAPTPNSNSPICVGQTLN